MTNSEVARVHLPVLGQVRAFALPFGPGPTKLTQTLGVARELARQALTAVVEITGEPPTCRDGCAACCRHLVMLTVPEAYALAAAVLALPEPRRRQLSHRFEAATRAAERAGILGPRGARRFLVSEYHGEDELASDVARRYFALGLACPLLEEESCTMYDLRPLACREHNVSSAPEHCTTFAQASRRGVPTLGLARAVARAAQSLAGLPPTGVPLPLLLEWYADVQSTASTALDVEVDGVAALRALLAALGDVHERKSDD